MLTIEYKPKLSDLIHAARTWKGSRWKSPSIIIGILILLFGFYLIYTGYLLLGILMVLIGVADMFNILPEHLLAPVMEWNRNPKFKEQHRLTFTQDELRFKTDTIDSTLKWDFYSKCVETPKAFILIYGKRMYSVIPKRAFTDSSQMQEFRNLIATVLENAE